MFDHIFIRVVQHSGNQGHITVRCSCPNDSLHNNQISTIPIRFFPDQDSINRYVDKLMELYETVPLAPTLSVEWVNTQLREIMNRFYRFDEYGKYIEVPEA